jgi:hypothetical protein
MTLASNYRRWLAKLILFFLFCFPWPAEGTLGKREEQIKQDGVALRLEKIQKLSVHRYRFILLSSNNLLIKEYVNLKTKTVFGVTWRGSRMPDLLVLLGFDPATMQGQTVYRSLRYTRIETPTVLLEMGGRLGSYYGPIRIDVLPPGVSRSEVVP